MFKKLIISTFLILHFTSYAFSETLTIACGSVGLERQYCVESVNRWSEMTGHQVNVIRTPDSSTDRLSMYQLLLREKHDTVDVFQVDVIWPGLLHKYLLDFTPYLSEEERDSHFTSLITNNTVDDRLVALPWYVDTGILFYRKDLLEKHSQPIPKTWNELTTVATHILNKEQVANPDLTGFVFQADAYEGLTCNVVEWLGSANTSIIHPSENKITLTNAQSVEILSLVKSWIGTISPTDITEFREEDARLAFQEGNAIFMRNWPYAWNLSQSDESEVKNKVGVTVLPGLTRELSGSGTLGGWQLSVTKATNHPDLAVDLVRFMTSESEQKRRLELGYFPTRNSLYFEAPSQDIAPLFAAVGDTLTSSIARPSAQLGKYYKDVSRTLNKHIKDYLVSADNDTMGVLQQTSLEISKSTIGNFRP